VASTGVEPKAKAGLEWLQAAPCGAFGLSMIFLENQFQGDAA